MRLYALALLTLLLAGCDKAQEPGNTAEGPTGIQETFDDSPGLIRSEIVNPAGRLVTIGYWLNGKKEGAWADYTEDERVYRLTTYVGGKKEGIYLEFNTDNRLMSDTTVTKELHLCHQHYGWSLQTIKEIIIAGFKSAFMPYREKADLVAEVSRELATFSDPRGEVTGGGELVESDAPTTSPPPPRAKPKLQVS